MLKYKPVVLKERYFIRDQLKTEKEKEMERKEKAVEWKHSGCNCAQAVLCAFAEETGRTEEEMKKLGAAFGAGMGCMDATCGALVGAGIALGIQKGGVKPVGRDAANLHRKFEEMCGATICRDLKGVDTGKVVCECDDCVRNAVTILEEMIA